MNLKKRRGSKSTDARGHASIAASSTAFTATRAGMIVTTVMAVATTEIGCEIAARTRRVTAVITSVIAVSRSMALSIFPFVSSHLCDAPCYRKHMQ
jgi:hypothetical protein